MKHLSQLTPAETLIILHGEKAALSELLKFTFMDLLLKQVLVTKEIEKQANPKDPITSYKYVFTGNNFPAYQASPHENVLLSVYKKSSDTGVLFKNLVKIAYQNARYQGWYQVQVISNSNIKDLFSRNYFERWFGGFSYTQKGSQVKKEIQAEVAMIESAIGNAITTDKNKRLDLLKSIGGNIFLLKGLEFSLAQEIDEEILKEKSKNTSDQGCSTFSSWTDYGYYSASFDSGCSSDNNSGSDGSDSGGDSGCSGCSGCGGGGD
jgi:hypothetical protein